MISFKQHITEMAPPPEDWDLSIFDKSYKKQLEYALSKATKLGQGSSRVVFEIPYENRMTVLKVAKNAKGLAQNNKEGDWSLYNMNPSITCPLIDKDEEHDDPKWIHLEKADKLSKSQFKSITGFSFDHFGNMLRDNEDYRLEQGIYKSRRGWGGIDWKYNIPQEDQEKIQESELFYDVTDLMANFDILAGDLQRIANWGLYKGNPVIIDLGFDSSVQEIYYNRKR